MTNCKRCDELLSILRDVKALMDSDSYSISYDSIYDRVSAAVNEDNN
ncbi:hypothetical protein [Dysgonomonas sp. ZJ709]|nr:hypothetical protein [Dysgonomonas sp. ZJ709]